MSCTWICSGVHWSRLTDFTLEMWTPRLRWMPAQRIHMNTPRFHDAHRGPGMGKKGKRKEKVRCALKMQCSICYVTFLRRYSVAFGELQTRLPAQRFKFSIAIAFFIQTQLMGVKEQQDLMNSNVCDEKANAISLKIFTKKSIKNVFRNSKSNLHKLDKLFD